MSHTHKIAVLAGDGIGPEVMAQAVSVLEAVGRIDGFSFDWTPALVGGAAYDVHGHPLPGFHRGHLPRLGGHPLRVRGRPQVGIPPARPAARARRPAPAAEDLRALRQPAPRHRLQGAARAPARCAPTSWATGSTSWWCANSPETSISGSPRARGRGRRLEGLRHHGLFRPRDRTDRPRGVPRRPRTPQPRHLHRQGQRAGGQRAVARGRDPRAHRRSSPTCSSPTCTWTTAPCSWCAAPGSST
jgi:hypothetical protein